MNYDDLETTDVVDTTHSDFKRFFEFLACACDKQLNYEIYKSRGNVYHLRFHEEEDEDDNSVEIFLSKETILKISGSYIDVYYDGILTAEQRVDFLDIDKFVFSTDRVSLWVGGSEFVFYYY